MLEAQVNLRRPPWLGRVLWSLLGAASVLVLGLLTVILAIVFVRWEGASIGAPVLVERDALRLRLSSVEEGCICFLPGAIHRVEVARADGKWDELFTVSIDDPATVDTGRLNIIAEPGARRLEVRYRSASARSDDGGHSWSRS